MLIFLLLRNYMTTITELANILRNSTSQIRSFEEVSHKIGDELHLNNGSMKQKIYAML